MCRCERCVGAKVCWCERECVIVYCKQTKPLYESKGCPQYVLDCLTAWGTSECKEEESHILTILNRTFDCFTYGILSVCTAWQTRMKEAEQTILLRYNENFNLFKKELNIRKFDD